MENIVLNAHSIKKSFGTGEVVTDVLRGIDFQLGAGEFVAIVGESGSGKSTFLYILAGIDKPTDGDVEMFGKSLSSLKDDELAALRRTRFSFVYQFDNLVPNLTAMENIMLPLSLGGVKKKDAEPKIAEIAEYLGISDRLKNFPKELSGGEQQRVAIARALVTSPEIIFLDEPTGSLDKERGRQVMELLRSINEDKGVALVMVTHSAAHAAYASRAVLMEDGVVRATDL